MDEIAALKLAILNALRSTTGIQEITGGRIYDVPPESVNERVSPYIHLGPFDSSEVLAECFETYDITGQIDIYSWGINEASSTMESLKISKLVSSLIRSINSDVLDLGNGYQLTEIRVQSKRVLTASDGKTKHVPMTISAIVDSK